MKEPKFKIGQKVYVVGIDYYNPTKGFVCKVTGVQITEHMHKTSKGNTTSTQVIYSVKFDGTIRNVHDKFVYAGQNDAYMSQRKKAKTRAKTALTRAKKTLEKNKKKLAELQEKLESVE